MPSRAIASRLSQRMARDLTQRNLCQLIVALAGDLLQRIAVYDCDIGGVLRIGNREGLHIRCASDLR